ncbi:MAG TPA: hypothetical protein P5531_04855 [Bacteroidales bacterium]|nr:hypothetical protein [Bacteroidales bacterium]HSA42667.1 hypothetical protein [Bacteroidales bacterium]
MKRLFWTAAAIAMLGAGTSCVKDDTPTKQKMEGVWEVTAAYDQEGKNILAPLEVPVIAFHLSSDNTVISTAGPMMMYIVYGDNKYTQIASTVDQVFNYASLDFTGGEFFVGDGVQDRFTLEMKLEGLPGQKTLTTLLDLLGISQSWLNVVIYHKFMDVGVRFNYDDTQMTWDFDNITKAVYNTKDQYGNYILWQGWPVNNFSRCSFVLKKRSQDISSIVQQHQ